MCYPNATKALVVTNKKFRGFMRQVSGACTIKQYGSVILRGWTDS